MTKVIICISPGCRISKTRKLVYFVFFNLNNTEIIIIFKEPERVHNENAFDLLKI